MAYLLDDCRPLVLEQGIEEMDRIAPDGDAAR